jgi:hypothetical protein
VGFHVSPAEAGHLTGKTERTIREWIRSGKLHAEPAGSRTRRPGVGPYRWLIDTDDLARVPGVALDPAGLETFAAKEALADTGAHLLERVTRLEQDAADLRREVTAIQKALETRSPAEGS